MRHHALPLRVPYIRVTTPTDRSQYVGNDQPRRSSSAPVRKRGRPRSSTPAHCERPPTPSRTNGCPSLQTTLHGVVGSSQQPSCPLPLASACSWESHSATVIRSLGKSPSARAADEDASVRIPACTSVTFVASTGSVVIPPTVPDTDSVRSVTRCPAEIAIVRRAVRRVRRGDEQAPFTDRPHRSSRPITSEPFRFGDEPTANPAEFARFPHPPTTVIECVRTLHHDQSEETERDPNGRKSPSGFISFRNGTATLCANVAPRLAAVRNTPATSDPRVLPSPPEHSVTVSPVTVHLSRQRARRHPETRLLAISPRPEHIPLNCQFARFRALPPMRPVRLTREPNAAETLPARN